MLCCLWVSSVTCCVRSKVRTKSDQMCFYTISISVFRTHVLTSLAFFDPLSFFMFHNFEIDVAFFNRVKKSCQCKFTVKLFIKRNFMITRFQTKCHSSAADYAPLHFQKYCPPPPPCSHCFACLHVEKGVRGTVFDSNTVRAPL